MFLLILFVTSSIQTAGYAVLDKFGFRKLKLLVLFLVLGAYFFVFPKMFMPTPDPEFVCAMPAMALDLAFWIFGALTALLTDIFYQAVIQKKLNLKN
jgi:hypothetical protein